jgi:2-haloalkanoic acid dehalogenase type II
MLEKDLVSSMQAIKAILFDLGGTLVETSHLKAISYISKKVSGELNIDQGILEEKLINNFKEIFRKAREGRFKTIAKIIEESLFNSIQDTKGSNLSKKVRSFYKEYIEKEVKIYPNVYNVLNSLRQMNLKLGIISNSDTYLTKCMLKKFSLDKFFDVVVTSSMSKAYKPNPKIFKVGLLKLGFSANQTVFIGNSDKDIQGAKSVGMITVLLKTKETSKLQASPDFIISNLDEVSQLVKQLV